MNVVDLMNNYPAIIGGMYLVVEVVKAMWKHKDAEASVDNSREQRASKLVLDILQENKEGLAAEKEDVMHLTNLLKRATFEITILERKVATLMSVIDKCVRDNPSAHNTFVDSMRDFNYEIDNMRKIKDV